ncbi:hypothetical protein OK348_00425 [Flavobacterium sp. MXW15]|uniref:Uncharacterized protein n=1 Tax=Xanthomonas chitinilytica TaxID=2989819 RepID=A0ABT3JR60_9XANT|nr:hypothetical protein [Xanthomonas sp. H13-6]MCW4453269.1 hypothetical protein [Flavobacterium sp. MXW15]MCW4470982.1 hypothetical protein [Xanthomonas sp. H13-6]
MIRDMSRRAGATATGSITGCRFRSGPDRLPIFHRIDAMLRRDAFIAVAARDCPLARPGHAHARSPGSDPRSSPACSDRAEVVHRPDPASDGRAPSAGLSAGCRQARKAGVTIPS